MISILILTYKQPVALELCLESIVKNQHYKNQILIVENGFCEENKPIFEKYKEHIEVLPFEENVGMNRALNLGVCNIKYEFLSDEKKSDCLSNDWITSLQSNWALCLIWLPILSYLWAFDTLEISRPI